MEDSVKVVWSKPATPAKGSAGLNSQCNGEALTVSAMAAATGGIGSGNLITRSKK